MCKLSTYLIIKNESNKTVITSAKTNSRLVLTDVKYRETWDNIQKSRYFTEQDIENSKLLIELRRLKMLVNINHSEITEIQKIEKSIDKLLHITIMPTENCNFRCEYCYQNFPDKSMNQENVNTIFEFIKSEVEEKGINKIVISWFGGEPLLCLSIIRSFSKKLINFAQIKKIKYESKITTNGYLLSSKIFDELTSLGVLNFQITIDGINHDEKRKLTNGLGTYNKIISNLINVKEVVNPDVKIVIRHNIDHSSFSKDFYMQLSQFFSGNDHFQVLIMPIGKLGGDNDKNLSVINTHKDLNYYMQLHQNFAEKVGLNV